MSDPYQVIVRPLLTEKSVANVGRKKYTFQVSMNANKVEIARAVEAAYKDAGIYTGPVVEVRAGGTVGPDGAVVSVDGHVKRAGRVEFQNGMTVLQAVAAAGGRDTFASRNVLLFRAGRQYCLDFEKLHHKNVVLRAGDSLQVEQKGVIDRWKGREGELRDLLPGAAE